MHSTHLSWLAVILATANARVLLPSKTTILPPLKEPKNPFLSVPHNATVQRRQEEYDTLCEVGNGIAVAQDLKAESGDSPQAFSQLWDWVEDEACTRQGCSDRKEHCVTASTGQDVCLTVDGIFSFELRSDFINAARGAFDRSVRTRELTSGTIETGTNLIRLLAEPGENSGNWIEVEIYNQGSAGNGDGCPQTLATVASAGAHIPEIGSMFGLVGFLCEGAEGVEWTGEATG
jgi:hypothetical protein